MPAQVKITLLSLQSADIDQLRKRLGAPNNPSLFPPHFLKATFPKLGGKTVIFEIGQRLVGVGFLFPRSVRESTRKFTLRFHKAGFHRAEGAADIDLLDEKRTESRVEELLGGDTVVFYDACVEQRYKRTTRKVEGIEVGNPIAEDALAIRQLQQAIWESEPDLLYPVDIHSIDFRAGTSLVARHNGEPVGFLFGFYKFDGQQLPHAWHTKYGGDFRLESQLLGVLSTYREHNIGFTLKKIQAENAQSEGIGVINWTADPLQYANARLNFGKLKAIAFDFYPDYYSFRNELNQVSASRFGITWLINTKRVTQGLSGGGGATVQNLNYNRTIQRFDKDTVGFQPDKDAETIAIEIPENWTALQRKDFEGASKWRIATDLFFQHYLGYDEGKYIVTGVGEDGNRKYLIAEKVNLALLECLGARRK